MPSRKATPVPTPEEGAAMEPTATHETPVVTGPSVLDRVRDNRVGPLATAVGIAVVVALLLAVLVPERPNLYAFTVLALLLTAAVGFTVRYLSRVRDLWAMATAFVATVLGLHVMAVTGTVDGVGGATVSGLLARIGAEAPGFDDALLGALATPAVSAGGVLAGIGAAIIVGWGPRATSREGESADAS